MALRDSFRDFSKTVVEDHCQRLLRTVLRDLFDTFVGNTCQKHC